MSKSLSPSKSEIYKYDEMNSLSNLNLFQLVGVLVENISETNKSRRKAAREIIDETLSFKLNVLEKLSLHFSKEAMLAERNKAAILGIFDTITFNKQIRK